VRVRNGCVECHGNDLAGKVVIDDPAMGQIFAPNITPERLREWTDGEIARAMRHGIGRDGRPLVMMPSQEYQWLSEGDIVAVVTYLRTLPVVNRPSGSIEIGPVMRLLFASGRMPNLLPAERIDHKVPFPRKPPEKVSVDFGKYLAQTACAGCHNEQLSGGPIPGTPPDWPPASNLTPAAIGHWSEADFIKTLRTGVNPDGHRLQKPMPVKLTSQMTDLELKALWAYLKSLPVLDEKDW